MDGVISRRMGIRSEFKDVNNSAEQILWGKYGWLKPGASTKISPQRAQYYLRILFASPSFQFLKHTIDLSFVAARTTYATR